MGSAVRMAGLFGGAALGLSACAVVPPTGPMIAAMPGPGKTLDQFRADDANCRFYADRSTNAGLAARQATDNGVGSAVTGTAIGAAAGALLGAAGGNAGAGAAIGAGSGLLVGGAAGANAAGLSSAGLQRAYDIAYSQCMVADGESVPGVNAPAYAGPVYAPPPYAYPPYPAYGPPVVVAPSVSFGWGWGWHRHWW